jgi:hypothetical protein
LKKIITAAALISSILSAVDIRVAIECQHGNEIHMEVTVRPHENYTYLV